MKQKKDAGLKGELQAHLSIMSALVQTTFGDVDAAPFEEFEQFMLNDGPHSARARAEFITAWLNFMHGAIDWDDVVEDAAAGHDLTYAETLHRVLNILLDDDLSTEQLREAFELARAINASIKGAGSCSQ
jgi:hypothetical protein